MNVYSILESILIIKMYYCIVKMFYVKNNVISYLFGFVDFLTFKFILVKRFVDVINYCVYVMV